jgi:hypothetical protein
MDAMKFEMIPDEQKASVYMVIGKIMELKKGLAGISKDQGEIVKYLIGRAANEAINTAVRDVASTED